MINRDEDSTKQRVVTPRDPVVYNNTTEIMEQKKTIS